MSAPELVEVDGTYYLIEGNPGAYSLYRCRTEFVATDAKKYKLRDLARTTTLPPPDDGIGW